MLFAATQGPFNSVLLFVVSRRCSVDVSLTHKMESFWLSRNTSAVRVTSTFAATPNGMFRVFPGTVVSQTEQPDPTRYESTVLMILTDHAMLSC